jgi:hypothetical protein
VNQLETQPKFSRLPFLSIFKLPNNVFQPAVLEVGPVAPMFRNPFVTSLLEIHQNLFSAYKISVMCCGRVDDGFTLKSVLINNVFESTDAILKVEEIPFHFLFKQRNNRIKVISNRQVLFLDLFIINLNSAGFFQPFYNGFPDLNSCLWVSR